MQNNILSVGRRGEKAKESQNRLFKFEAITETEKLERRRPASLDLNNRGSDATISSPRLEIMKKSSVSSRNSDMFPSPRTPNYRHENGGIQKGWSSERVPLPANSSRKYVNTALLPFNNGKTLPSKWEDAEKWIFSPVSRDDLSRPSLPPYRTRPKSKSGPLGPPEIAYFSTYSPCFSMFEGSNGGNGSYPGSQDEELNETKDVVTKDYDGVSRRDMATQMSPEGSPHSSPKKRSMTPSSLLLPIVELQSHYSSILEVRDVQVDDRVTITKWSKKHGAQVLEKDSGSSRNWKKKCNIEEEANSISKFKGEEAKITAWENLQKAKAEAAIQKLEVKLEKTRSSSMDKIMNKLRSAKKKAQEMRSSVAAKQIHDQLTKTPTKLLSFRKTSQMGSLSGCFICRAV